MFHKSKMRIERLKSKKTPYRNYGALHVDCERFFNSRDKPWSHRSSVRMAVLKMCTKFTATHL